jgi:hypothetical protein
MEIIPKETPSSEHPPESTPFSYYLSKDFEVWFTCPSGVHSAIMELERLLFHITWVNRDRIFSEFI